MLNASRPFFGNPWGQGLRGLLEKASSAFPTFIDTPHFMSCMEGMKERMQSELQIRFQALRMLTKV